MITSAKCRAPCATGRALPCPGSRERPLPPGTRGAAMDGRRTVVLRRTALRAAAGAL
ncbi:hypothetical protein GT016_30485, partial [Streptomyces sp. SID3915]|nr:hypothetical protein [Streptomyces sp. SID3915]